MPDLWRRVTKWTTAVSVLAMAACMAGTDSGYSHTELPAAPAGGPCQALASEPFMDSDGFANDEFLWYDSRCAARRADMVRNTLEDPRGHFGGYMHRYTYTPQSGNERVCTGSTADHPGFGTAVSHSATGVISDSQWQLGTASKTIFKGTHHAIYEYTTAYPIDNQPAHVTMRWFFATGRDHPIYAITYDMSAAKANTANADSRAPYGDIDWDGGAMANVAGVGWGDHYRFLSTTPPISLENGWDYTQANTVPFTQAWTQTPDAEMGAVQTQTYMQHDGGGSNGYDDWTKISPQGPMPDATAWPYQINQYELDGAPASKRMAWGTNNGAVGQQQYPAYGNDRMLVGYPYQSYSTYVVFGLHSTQVVIQQVQQVEAVQNTQLTAGTGLTVNTQGPAGVGRTDLQTYAPVGYDPIFGMWSLTVGSAPGDLSFTMDTGTGQLNQPMWELANWSGAAPAILRDGKLLQNGTDYFASVDTASKVLYVTLAGSVVGQAAFVLQR